MLSPGHMCEQEEMVSAGLTGAARVASLMEEHVKEYHRNMMGRRDLLLKG